MLISNRDTIKFSCVYHLNWCFIVPCVVYVSRTTLNYCQVVNFSDTWNRFYISFSCFLLLSVTWEKTVQIDMFVLQFIDTGMALLIHCYNKTQDFKSQETRTSELVGGNIRSFIAVPGGSGYTRLHLNQCNMKTTPYYIESMHERVCHRVELIPHSTLIQKCWLCLLTACKMSGSHLNVTKKIIIRDLLSDAHIIVLNFHIQQRNVYFY